MTFLVLGLAVFFAAHFYSAFRSRDPQRDIKQRMGEGPYMGLYSLVSAVGLGLIVYGYWSAPAAVPLYVGPAWARSAALIMMAAAFVLLVSAYAPPTHFKAWVKHPMLSGVILWAGAHLLIAPDVKALLLFGAFGLYAIIDFLAVLRRAPAPGDAAAPTLLNDLIALVVGGGAYLFILLWAHQALFGVAPR